MAYLDTNEAFEHFRDRTLEGIQAHFPLKGKFQTLHLDKLEVHDDLHADDLRAQHKAKVEGGSFAVPVYGSLRLVENATGKVVSQRRIRMAEIPKMTQRYSYLMNGQEYHVDNQWQLKPGAYTRRRQNGELETRFNVTGKSAFDMVFDPNSKQFHVEYNKAKLPVYPLMKSMGVDDATIEHALGKEIFTSNKNARGAAGTLEKFYKTDKKEEAPSKEEAEKHFYETMKSSKMRPEATAVTLGKPLDHVNGEAFILAAQKLIKVQGGHPEDDRDSLIFKDLRSAGDFVKDKMRNATRAINAKVARKINTAKDVRDIVKSDMFNDPIKQAFNKNSAAAHASQINPVEMISSTFQTTIMGSGGIQSEQQIVNEAKFVNPSHLGFLDPIHTPEGNKTGVSLRLPMGVKKVGSQVVMPLYNLKTGKVEDVTPAQFTASKVVLPDQVRWKDGKPSPVTSSVKMAGKDNEISDGKFSDAHYVMRHPSQLFNMTSNLIPYLGNSNGNRASMATRHIEQAISLLHRDAPLVQVSTGVDKPGLHSFEHVMGEHASHQSAVDGVVKQIKNDAIIIHGSDGKLHEAQIYNNYPLNDAKSVLHSTPIVKVGDRVKAGQTIADTNYSRKGVLALGTNLRVGYVPFKGYNFEDGVVISKTAAEKLSSIHMYKPSLSTDGDTKVSRTSFMVHHPGVYKSNQVAHIGEDGLPKIGSVVAPGDPLVLAVKPFELKDRLGESAIRKALTGTHTDKSLRWDGDTPGEVVGVSRNKDGINVHVRAVEAMQVGDKLAGRYGNKGICTLVLPDHEMPHYLDPITKKTVPLEVALNPSGVPGRMNVGQVLETAVSKVAEKTGKPVITPSFTNDSDMVAHVRAELKAHGLSDTEELHDPVTGQSLGQALVGKQHILKLVHQVDKKVAVSSGMPAPHNPATYDINLQPKSGQRIGALGMYALLAHGAKANLREMQTFKGEGPDDSSKLESKRWRSQHNDVWKSIQTGSLLPTPKTTFAFEKFETLLKGAGVNIEKKGHEVVLSPLTDKHILNLSEGRALPKPGERLDSKIDKETGELKPRPGGLFDKKLTGGHSGFLWSHIKLAEPMPNPVFEDPIRALTGWSGKDYEAVVAGTKGVHPNGQLADLGKGVFTSGTAVEHVLKQIDVPKELKRAQEQLNKAKPAEIDRALKKVKYLTALDHLGMSANEAYVLHHVPVIPPVMRPASPMADGNIKYADINHLYSDFAQVNEQLRDPVLSKNLTEERKSSMRAAVYDGLKAITGYGIRHEDASHKGLLHQLSGSSPKYGYFQNTLVQKRQDLTMRSTIVPEPALSINEVGLPREHAIDLFRPFLVKKLQEMGAAPTPLDAQKLLLKKGNQSVHKALDKVLEERPVILKRDPALHKYSTQGFNAKVVEGNAIKIHPLVVGGFNADFDGDTMSVFVPISREAVMETHKMKPTNNLFSESSGGLAYVPSLESALGLYKLSLVGKNVSKSFKGPGDVIDAARSKKIDYNDVVSMGGKNTTAGRVILSTALPTPMQHAVLHDLDLRLDKGGMTKLLTTAAKNHKEEFDSTVNKLKNMGNGTSFGAVALPLAHTEMANLTDPKKNIFVPVGTHSLSLADFDADKEIRHSVLSKAHAEAEHIRTMPLGKAEQDRRVVEVYTAADKKMRQLHEEKMDKNPSNLFMMYRAGVKPGWDQYKQMVLAPMLLKDSADRTIPTPVTKSYGEGLDVAGYWTQMHGARRGSVQKVQEVQEPGYMSKLMMNNMMHLVVAKPDCGTSKGILMSAGEKDVHDRLLAQDYRNGHIFVKAGTTLTPDIVGVVRAADKNAKLLVRSPLKCEHEHGLCQKCVGLSSEGKLHDLGTNFGILAAQTVGERAVQLTLKSFHCMHEHSIVLVRRNGRIEHTTLGRAFSSLSAGEVIDGEEIRPALDLEVWDRDGWVRVKSARRHLQQPGTSMVFTRSRAGYGIISQDNHPHMLVENTAACGVCGNYPKKSNGGRQYYCRTCRTKFEPAALVHSDYFTLVEPQELRKKSHAAMLDRGPAPSLNASTPLVDGWLAGIYCAEGCVHVQKTKNGDYTVGFDIAQNAGRGVYAKIGSALRAEFGEEKFGTHPKGYQVYGCTRGQYFEESFGRYSRNKGLPDGWSGYSADWLARFVSGVFDGDGTLVSNADSVWLVARIDTTSFLLAQQVHWILRSVGINARVITTPWRKSSVHQGFAVTFVLTEAAKAFLSDSVRLHDMPAKPAPNDERFSEVVDYVKPVRFGAPPYVYDLETESGTLFVGGFWTHNTGGVVEQGGGKLLNSFARFDQLMKLGKKIPNSASLAMRSGTIDKIEPTSTGVNITIGGQRHFVGKDAAGNDLHKPLGKSTWPGLSVGTRIEAGSFLSDPSRTYINPHDLYKATGSIDKVQNHMATEIYDLYKDEGIKRRHVETVVKAMSNLTKVVHPGDSTGILRGEFQPLSVVQSTNATLSKQGLRQIEHTPVLKGVNMLPLSLQEDWMAKLQHQKLRDTVVDAAAVCGKSNIHGLHPIPGLAYGAEFGVTKAKSTLPSYGHLKDVPEHHY